MIHIDDIMICSNNDDETNRFLTILQQRFDIIANYNADAYLGIHFENMQNHTIKLSQPKLLQQIFEEFPPKHTTKLLSPMITTSLHSSIHDHLNQPISTHTYLHLLGQLMYLTRSRPDILTAVSFAATHSVHPTQHHYNQLLHIVNYLGQTQDKGLILKSFSDKQDLYQLYCYVDASYLIHPDGKSHTGYNLSFGSTGTFYCKSIKQRLVSTSSTHAETRALYTLVQDIIFIITLCQEISFPIKIPALIFIDNYPLYQLSNELASGMKKCKHFIMLIAYIKEQVEQHFISVNKISTHDNPADILTKPIIGKEFHKKANLLLNNI
jgi:hypothetical protein